MELIAFAYLIPIIFYLGIFLLLVYLGFARFIFKFGDFFIVFGITAYFSYRFLENISYNNTARFITCIIIALAVAIGMYFALLYLNMFKKAYWFLMVYHFLASIVNAMFGMFFVIEFGGIPHRKTQIYEFLIFKNNIANSIINFIIFSALVLLIFKIRKEELIIAPYERDYYFN